MTPRDESIVTMERCSEKFGFNFQTLRWTGGRRRCFTGIWGSGWMLNRVIVSRIDTGFKKICCLSAGLHLIFSKKKSPHKEICFPSADHADDKSVCQDAVKSYRADFRAESRWDPSMYLSAWNDGWLPVGQRNTNRLQLDRQKSSPCVCVCFLLLTAGNFTPMLGQTMT